MKKKFVIIDGLCVLFRAFYAIKDMQNKNGQNIAGVYGFARELLSIKRTLQPKYMSVAFDMGKKTWRHEMLDTYKANRKKSPPELLHQFGWVRDICRACGIFIFEEEGQEADDLIASCAKEYKNLAQVWIATYDKDLFQLIEDKNKVLVCYPFKKTLITEEVVFEKYKIYPKQMADFLALTGDKIDGIDGIAGIGPQTAISWLTKYQSIDSILENISELEPIKKREILQKNLEKLQTNRILTSLRTNLQIGELEEKKLQRQPSRQISQVFKTIGIESMFADFESEFCEKFCLFEECIQNIALTYPKK